MSAPVDEAWPKLDSVWRTLEDALLASELAALKTGFSHLDVTKDSRTREDWRWIRCSVDHGQGSRIMLRCRQSLFKLEMVDAERDELGWKIIKLYGDVFLGARHPNHYDRSAPVPVSPCSPVSACFAR